MTKFSYLFSGAISSISRFNVAPHSGVPLPLSRPHTYLYIRAHVVPGSGPLSRLSQVSLVSQVNLLSQVSLVSQPSPPSHASHARLRPWPGGASRVPGVHFCVPYHA
jgi:hypothetical protein